MTKLNASVAAAMTKECKLAMTRSVSDVSLEKAGNEENETFQAIDEKTKQCCKNAEKNCDTNSQAQRPQKIQGSEFTIGKMDRSSSLPPKSSALVGRPLPAAPVLPSIHNPAPPVAPILLPLRPMLPGKRSSSALDSSPESFKRFKKQETSSRVDHLVAVAALSELRFLNERLVRPAYSPLPPPPGLAALPPPFRLG